MVFVTATIHKLPKAATRHECCPRMTRDWTIQQWVKRTENEAEMNDREARHGFMLALIAIVIAAVTFAVGVII